LVKSDPGQPAGIDRCIQRVMMTLLPEYPPPGCYTPLGKAILVPLEDVSILLRILNVTWDLSAQQNGMHGLDTISEFHNRKR